MKINLRTSFLIVIASGSGLIVLLGYFINIAQLASLRDLLLQWATVVTAVALVAGVINLARLHLSRVRTFHKSWFYSLALLLSLLAALVVLFVFGPVSSASGWMYRYVLLPLESSLMALLAVVLTFAFGRMFYRRVTPFTLVFAGTTLFFLVTIFFMGTNIPGLSELRALLMETFVVGGARGILLGVVLGTVATGLRVLLGADRPYGE
jgi:hypothetical protein